MLQRIVKALPYKLLLVQKDSRPFWCFVFLSRCLIYKVHAAVTAGFHCTTFSSLCQELFLSFSANSLLYRVALASDFIRISHPELFVKNFFQLFFEVLSVFSPAALSGDPIRIPHSKLFVKNFFRPPGHFILNSLWVLRSISLARSRVWPLAQGFDPSLKGLTPRSSAWLY